MPSLTIPQAAARLGCSTDTVRRRMKRGELKAEKDAAGRVVVIFADPPPAETPAPPNGASADELARVAGDLAHVRDLLAEVSRQRDGLAREREEAREREAALSHQLSEAQRGEAELRQLLAASQGQVRALLPAPKDSGDVQATAQQVPGNARQVDGERRSWWQVWRRG